MFSFLSFLTPSQIQDGSFVILSGEAFQSENIATLEAIEETSVADLISHVTGGPVVSFTAPRQVLSHVNSPFYNKAKANLLFVINEAGLVYLTLTRQKRDLICLFFQGSLERELLLSALLILKIIFLPKLH